MQGLGDLRWAALLTVALCPVAAGGAPLATGPLARIDSLIAASLPDSAQSVIDAHLPGARARADSSLLLGLLSRRGEIFATVDRAREAEPVLLEALALAEARGDSASLCGVLRWLGVSVDHLGRRAEAGAIHARLRAIAHTLGDRRNEGWALYGLGWQADQDGRVDEAAPLYRQALDLFLETRDAGGEIWARIGLGSLAQRRGDYTDAVACYEQAMRRADEAGHTSGRLRALNSLGTVEFARGDPAKALSSFQRAHELQTLAGNLREAVTPGLNVAICQTALGRHNEAEAGLEQGIALCVEQGWEDLELTLMQQLARVKYRQGAFSDAVRLYRDCLARQQILSRRTRVQVGLGLANVLAEMDSSAAALGALDETARDAASEIAGETKINFLGVRALRLLDLGRFAEALEDLRASNAEMTRIGVTTSRAAALAGMAQAYRALGLRDSARLTYELAREAWDADRRVSASPEWRERVGLVGRRIYTGLAAELIDRPADASGRTGVAEAFERLQAFKARTLLERMRGPGADRAAEARETIGLAELQAVLQPGEVFLDCYVGEERSFVFAVTRDEVTCAPMPPRDLLLTRARLYRAILTDADGGAIVGRTAAGIDSFLFGDLRGRLAGMERVFISPDVPLHAVPFGLAGGVPWARVPSASVLWHLRAGRETGGSADPGSILALAGHTRPERPSLRGARREVAQLARLYRDVDTEMPAAAATAAPDWAALQPYALLHFAAHARVLDQTPWDSEIELGPDSASSPKARQIASLRLSARLGVLSSCESAGGGIMSGEGVTGLSSAFLAAGVPAVIATLWPVDDAVAERLMERFYSALAEGRGAGAALAQAQADIRDDPATAAPFYWAGFILIGDGQTTVALARRAGPDARRTMAALLLLLAALLVGVRRARRDRNTP